jgi:excisionase family DNA binding protein
VKKVKAENQETESQQTEAYGESLSLRFMGVREVAHYLRVKPSTIYSMAGNRKIPFYRIGRQIRFRKSEIDQWAQELKQPVVDLKVEAKKVLRSIAKKADLDVDRIVKKVVEQSKKKGYNVHQEKPGRIKGLRMEVKHGAL